MIHVYLIIYQFRLEKFEQYSHYNLNYSLKVNDFDLLASKSLVHFVFLRFALISMQKCNNAKCNIIKTWIHL